MKKVIFSFVLGIVVSMLVAFTVVYEPNKKTAEVKQQNGLLIFQQSEPVLEYEVLGSEKISVSFSGQPQELLNMALKKATKKYNNADGIIFRNDNMTKFDIIRFENE